MEQEELVGLLQEVRTFDGYRRTYSYLSEQQISAIVLAVLPTVRKRIEQARGGEVSDADDTRAAR